MMAFLSTPQLIITDETHLEDYDGDYAPIEEIGGEQKTIIYETVRENGTTTSLDYSGTYLIVRYMKWKCNLQMLLYIF